MRYIILLLLFLDASVAYSQIPPLNKLIEVEGPPTDSTWMLGTGFLGIGDVNSDGKSDFAVSAAGIGKTLIYFGGAGVLDDSFDISLTGGGMIIIGDFNGDTCNDLAINDNTTMGKVYIYIGRKDSVIKFYTVPNYTLVGEESESYFGASMSSGDLNADGIDDLVISARYYQYYGKIYIYMGKTQPTFVPDYIAVGDSSTGHYAFNVRIGDINGDKKKDLLIASEHYSSYPTQDYSFIDLYYGRNNWAFNRDSSDQRVFSTENGIRNLYYFSLVDINGDGREDFTAGKKDSVCIFYGRSDSLRHIPDKFIVNPDTSFFPVFGFPAFTVGDVNGDGYSDFVIRAGTGGPARCALLYLGGPYMTSFPVGGYCKGFVDGSAFEIVSGVGDVNGDGNNDWGTTAPLDALPPHPGYIVIFKGDSSLHTSIQEELEPSTSFSLFQNYPNPFNSKTTIRYTLKDYSSVSLQIFDIVGNEIATLVNETKPKGLYEINFDASQYSSGLYFYKLQVGNFSKVKKMVIIK